jgi:hypothetical protein
VALPAFAICAQPGGDRRSVLEVGRPHRRAQPRPGVVGPRDRVVLVVERQDRQGRAELLLDHHAGLVGGVGHTGSDVFCR